MGFIPHFGLSVLCLSLVMRVWKAGMGMFRAGS